MNKPAILYRQLKLLEHVEHGDEFAYEAYPDEWWSFEPFIGRTVEWLRRYAPVKVRRRICEEKAE